MVGLLERQGNTEGTSGILSRPGEIGRINL